ncbi:MAG TPA: hypothetical protein VLI94_00040, partial [Solirubrobacterales bacterium]|nr:hypothetical protein [Solirubrobacterales bacterium]
GFIGNQTAVPKCTAAEFNTRSEGYPACPDESAVGYVAAEAEFEVIKPEDRGNFVHAPVYLIEPPAGVAAQLGFVILNVPITIDVKVSPTYPNELVAELTNVSQAALIYGSRVILWGNPGDPEHDELRGSCLGDVLVVTPEPISLCEKSVAPTDAFLTLPRSCKGPLLTNFTALSWAGDTASGTATTANDTDCSDLLLDPENSAISVQPTTTQGSSPSGLQFGLTVDDPGLLDPTEKAQADIAEVSATLPEGMVLNPSAANGLAACSFAQYQAEGPQWSPSVGCPQASKVGTVEVTSPLIDQPLTGDLYVASQDDNPFNTLFALYMIIRNERYGVLIKQAGRIDPDPVTGQLTSTFSEIPELPFAELSLSFRSGPRAPLGTPPTCATHTASALFTPSSGTASITETASFAITSGPSGNPCPAGPGPFAPTLVGGTADNQAGAYSPFAMQITRQDGEQQLTRFDAVLPQGLVGKIAGLGRCTDAEIAAAKQKSGRAEIAAPSCPASARIGSVTATAGLGPFPVTVGGSLYLAGPYAGAPLSVVVVTPAVTGPFDLGTTVTREALDLNPTTAEVEVSGIGPDGLVPRILEGVPVQLRSLAVSIDRPGFILNATGCEPKTLRGTLFGTPTSHATSTRYQAKGCGALGYRPKLTLGLLGATKRGKFPRVRATLIPRAGDSNTASAVVALPPSQQIENAHINNPCTRVQFNAGACPPKSILGTARAYSPLLDAPLEGPVYFRSNGGERELPDIVADLNGQFRIILVGFIDTKGKRIRTTFANVPDAPVSRFEINLAGGKRGLLVNNRNICAKKQKAKVRMVAHNGRPFVRTQVVKTSCKGKPKPKPGKGGGGKGR